MTARSPSEVLERLPPQTRQRLEELRDTVAKQLGDEFVSLVVYGSLARGEFGERSDVDVVLVLRTASRAHLEKISNALRLARFSSRIETIILRADEIARSADVFPLFYDDIRANYVVVAGSDPFAALTISDAHRRLRLEQELRQMLMRFRGVLADSAGSPQIIADATARKLRRLRAPLVGLTKLRGVQCDDGSLDALLRAAQKLYDIDLAALAHIHESPAAACDALCQLLTRAVDDVDSLETARGAS